MQEYEHKSAFVSEYNVPVTPEQWAPYLKGGWRLDRMVYKDSPCSYADAHYYLVFIREKPPCK